MLNSKPKELLRAEQLINKAKFKEALEIIENFERKEIITQKDALIALVLKGRIYYFKNQWKETRKLGEKVYKESQEIGDLPLTIDALLLKGEPWSYEKLDDSFQYVLEAENKLNEISEYSSLEYEHRRALVLHYKARIYHFKGIYDKALEYALLCLEIQEKIGSKIDIAQTFIIIAFINMHMGEHNAGLEYAMKCLNLQEELNNRVGIATGLYLVGLAYNYKGYYNKAIEYSKKSLNTEGISDLAKVNNFYNLGFVYRLKGELNQALKYLSQAVELSEKENYNIMNGLSLFHIGGIYEMKDNDSKAIEYYQRSLAVSEKSKHSLVIGLSLGNLISINIDNNSRKQAQEYLERLKKLVDQTESREFTHFYLNAKAYFLKTSGRTRDRAEAEILWRQIVNEKIANPTPYYGALCNLCEFLIEELAMSNDSEILNELNPLIFQWQKITEKTNSYSWLAWTLLFQAKVALIDMKIEKGKKLMTQAQHAAELHGLTRLAQRISYEHDKLLEEINQWETFKTTDAPISERIKLASVEGVINQLEERRALEVPELVDEEPVLLLILSEGGRCLFSNSFSEDLDFEEDLVSSFLAAFNSFSVELFSEGLDRARFGDYTILMESMVNYSVCYLFKGQTYLAKQKIAEFSEKILNTKFIWQLLDKKCKSNQVLEIKDSPFLEHLITNIFTS
jgi:tetratricopeptide (TPR) repeat protein